MANLKFSSEILDYVLFRAGEAQDGTSDFEAQALIEVNRAYRAIWMGGGELAVDVNEPWLWLKMDPPGTLTLQPVVDAGTVSVTNNSTSITFSDAPAASMAGRFFRTDDKSDVFRISTHTAGAAAATLDSVYTGDTNTAATFRVMKLEYDLAADILRPIAPMRVSGYMHIEIEGIDLSVLDREYPLRDAIGGIPDKFALVTETKVRFNAYGGDDAAELFRVEYDYLQKPDDLTNSGAEEPLVPLEHRQVIADAALFFLFQSKNDNRAAGMATQAAAGVKAMQRDNQARLAQIGGRSMGRIYTRGRRGFARGTKVLVVG